MKWVGSLFDKLTAYRGVIVHPLGVRRYKLVCTLSQVTAQQADSVVQTVSGEAVLIGPSRLWRRQRQAGSLSRMRASCAVV